MPPTEEEERRKIIIDGGSEVAGLMVCLSGSAALRSSRITPEELDTWVAARDTFMDESRALLNAMRD